MKTSNFSSISCNNKFTWRYVIEMFEFLLAIIIYDLLFSLLLSSIMYFGLEKGSIISIGDLYSSLILCIFVLLYCVLKYFKWFRTGEYSIIGDELIVKENFFSHEAKLTIPISGISNVRFTPKFTDLNELTKQGPLLLVTPFRLLEITVKEQKYVLFTYAHAKELYAELNKRISITN